jgi:glycosyltransferase involved in cell wall biosynthesis
VQFHLLSFEGPDLYSYAGGIATRDTGLSQALGEAGFQTHLWFVGDAARPGHETIGRLQLHRWCQWISRYHPGGVYDGEEGKRRDYAASLPPWLLRNVLGPHLATGRAAAVIAEDWQTADAVIHLDHLLRLCGLRHRVALFWNANNTFGFERVDWARLAEAAVITTVSRYMQRLMAGRGIEAGVVPNGLTDDAFELPGRAETIDLHRRTRGRVTLAKVARFDPDKRWISAVAMLAELKRLGLRPLLIARGGAEPHGGEVLSAASAAGLRVVDRAAGPGAEGLLKALDGLDQADVVHLRSHLDPGGRRLLFHGVAAVLANSVHEPFGLVGLETQAAGGVACTGGSGEDYAVAGRNAVVLATSDPRALAGELERLRRHPEEERSLRRIGRRTARDYLWAAIIRSTLLPRLEAALPRLATPLLHAA